MKTFREMLGKPSAAVRAMCEGLKEQSRRVDFEIDMGTFGRSSAGTCFGCAATCAVQKAADISFDRDSIHNTYDRAAACGTSYFDLHRFEYNINELRIGNPRPLFGYFDQEIPADVTELSGALPVLTTANWRAGLPDYERLAEALKQHGL